MKPDPIPPAVSVRLFAEGFAFDFFQAVRLLQALDPSRPAVGRGGPPSAEAVRFRAHASLSFPPGSIQDLTAAKEAGRPPELIQSFLGLTGPSGVLPRHYTEMILRLDFERRGSERHALRDWLDLFNHRMTSLFYRAWEKYRPYLDREREGLRPDAGPDAFALGLLSLVGHGTPALRGRLVVGPAELKGEGPEKAHRARVDDLALIHYSGLLSHRPRSAAGLRAILLDYFGLGVEIEQFRGRWLPLAPASRVPPVRGAVEQQPARGRRGDRRARLGRPGDVPGPARAADLSPVPLVPARPGRAARPDSSWPTWSVSTPGRSSISTSSSS